LIERDGVRLHYLEWSPAREGRGPALLLLHGLSSNARVWERMAAQLPARRVIALDQRAHGLSDRPAAGYAMAELVADAAHAVDALGLGRPVVGGHSWGAAVALALAADRPELAAGLAFVDGPAGSFSRRMTWEEAAARMQPPLPVYADLEAAVEAQRSFLGDVWGEDLRGFVRSGLVETDGGLASTLTTTVRHEILAELYRFEPEALFAGVEGPILIAAAGRPWPGAPPELIAWRQQTVAEVERLRPDARVRWYDSLHDVPLFCPAELGSDVERLAIAAGFADVARDASALDGDWTRPAQSDEGAWDAKDVLAHLSSSQASLAAVIGAPPREAGGDGRPASLPRSQGEVAPEGRRGFDPDRWNASQVRRRRETPPAELVRELRDGAATIHAALMEHDLEAPTTVGPFAGVPIGEAMTRMLGHQRLHLAELRAALAAG
jgi:alpha/beta hydrolase fold/DinB superfamily